VAVRVVTVDDQAAFRRAAGDVIRASPGFELAGEATSGEEGLSVVERLQPDLVLLDLRMPGIDGVETARRLSAKRPGLVIILISVQEAHEMPGAQRCGAAAFVPKQKLAPALLSELWAEHGRSSN
jgi:two-component system invasion response regulator UvrY